MRSLRLPRPNVGGGAHTLYLQKLHLVNFRNYQDSSLDFDEGVQCLLGDNGSGKTNLLDAIHYLSLSRSSLNATDADNIRTGQSGFILRGIFLEGDKQTDVAVSYQSGQKKSLFENGIEYQRLSAHLGKYPVVMIAPADIELVWSGSEVRRKFFDTLMSQVDRDYLENLISYNAHLKMRNSLLRHFAERGKVDRDLLEANDTRLIASGTHVHERRTKFISALIPVLEEKYRSISGAPSESVYIEYKSDLRESNLGDLLGKNLQRDLSLLRTTVGVHRDDFVFRLNEFELKRYGSQGQQKSFLLSIKLAEFDVIALAKRFKPILLLDDIFDKLDNSRISSLVSMMHGRVFGQVFLTDARPDRTRELLSTAGINAKTFSVENGSVVAGT